jgi:hypothetical protein
MKNKRMLENRTYANWFISLLIGVASVMFAYGASAAPQASSSYYVATLDDHYETPLLAIGQVTAIDTINNTAQVNGQTILLDAQSQITSASNISYGIDALQTGDHVAVSGDLVDLGFSLATNIIIFDDTYVAGDSSAYVRVLIDSLDETTVKATSGSTSIDLVNVDRPKVLAGIELEAFGSAYGNICSAESISILSLADEEESNLQKIRASGVRKIRASGVRKIRASGVRKIRASGVRKIRASGVRKIRASGVRKIRTSGVRKIRASGVR